MDVEEKNEVYYIKNSYFDKLKQYNTVYLLDSNIVAHLEKFYFSPTSLDEKKTNSVIQLLIESKQKKIKLDYLYALTELSADYLNGGVINEKYNKMKIAINNLQKKSEKELIKYSKYGKHIEINIQTRSSNDFGEITKVIDKTLKLLVFSFAPLIKFYEILDKEKGANKVKIFREYLDFLDSNIKMMNCYEIVAAIYYLFTSGEEHDQVQALLKINNKVEIIRKSWNSSWDITFLRYINDISARLCNYEQGVPQHNYILITMDKALGKISKLINIDNAQGFDNKFLTTIIVDDKEMKKDYVQALMKIYKEYMTEEKIRARKKYIENNQEKIIDDLYFNINEIVESYVAINDLNK